MALPRSTLISTLVLVGIGFAAVIAMLIFAFSMLNTSGNLNPDTSTPSPAANFPSPTPEYLPNNLYGETESQDTPAPNTSNPTVTPTSSSPFGF